MDAQTPGGGHALEMEAGGGGMAMDKKRAQTRNTALHVAAIYTSHRHVYHMCPHAMSYILPGAYFLSNSYVKQQKSI